METKYYMNKPVEVIQLLDDGRTLVRVGEDAEDEYYGTISESVDIIVETEDLRDKYLSLDEKYNDIVDKAKTEAHRLIKEANVERIQIQNDCANNIGKLKAERDELLKSLSQYEGLKDSIAFINPEYKYVVKYNCGDVRIQLLSESKCSLNDRHLSAIVIRKDEDSKEFISRMGYYSDGSGSSTPCKFFKSKEDAELFAVKCLDKALKNNFSLGLRGLVGYNITSPAIDAYRKKQEERVEADKIKKVERLKKELEELS